MWVEEFGVDSADDRKYSLGLKTLVRMVWGVFVCLLCWEALLVWLLVVLIGPVGPVDWSLELFSSPGISLSFPFLLDAILVVGC